MSHGVRPFKFSGLFCLCLLILFACLQKAEAEEKKRLELGIGLGAASLPHYRGSDEKKTFALPFPYFTYEGKRLKVNREGGQFDFIRKPGFHLDISAGLTPSVGSGDNKARVDMPALVTVLEVGPRAEFYLYDSANSRIKVRAGIPLRQAIIINDGDVKGVGWVFSPYLQLLYKNDWNTHISIGPLWATEAYHHYFYEVEPQYATASRAAYDAHGGYNGARVTLFSSRRFDHTWLGIAARYDSLSGAVFEDSPLVKQNSSFIVGVFIVRIFLNSAEGE